jgi:integrase
MPGSTGIKAVKRPGTSVFYARGTVRGQRVYESTGTADPEQAKAYCALREAELWQSSVFGTKAAVPFPRAVTAFIQAHQPSEPDQKRLKALLLHFKTTTLDKIDQEALDRAYQVLLPANASNANKLRTVLAPLRAVLNHAAKRKWCDVPKFDIPVQPPSRVAFLRPDQATSLIQHAAPHLRPLLAFCLFTGARLSEALELQWEDVDLFAGRVVFRDTKNGRERHYDLPPAAIASLSAIPHRAGNVFLTREVRNKAGKVVIKAAAYHNNDRQAGGQIKTGWAIACRHAGLPGQWVEYKHRVTGKPKRRWTSEFTPHDMRHTWATWHYCLHKDLLLLRNEGGWQSVDQVEIYAHKMPDAYRPQIEAFLAGTPAGPVRKEA